MKKLITKDSRLVTPGSIYCCFIGDKVDGHDYINDALARGASAIYGTKDIDGVANYTKVDDINQKYIELAQNIYNFNQIKNEIKIIGITGTDGKTSSAYLLTNLLNHVSKAAYLGTSGFIIDNQTLEYSGFTTPFAEDLFLYIKQAYEAGCKYFVMEVSSHSLVQHRFGEASNFKFAGVILTNLTPEHLDFHHTMEEYCQAKLSILNYTDVDSKVIINADDPYFYQASLDKDVISFSCDLNKANHQIGVISSNLNGIDFYINHQEVVSNLIGDFNIYNLAGVLILFSYLGYDISSYKETIASLSVPGRMEITNLKNNNKVIVDFAHTPDSIEKVLQMISGYKQGKLIVVNGCAGERDTTKRPTIGRIMDQYADVIVLTTDDPRSELVSNINAEIKAGITNLNKVMEIENRYDAIKFALQQMHANDIVICLGKGGQNVQYMANGPVSYFEQDVINQLIKELKL